MRGVGKGTKVVLVPLPPAVGRAIDQAVAGRSAGRSCATAATGMDRHVAIRRLQHRHANYILATYMATGTGCHQKATVRGRADERTSNIGKH